MKLVFVAKMSLLKVFMKGGPLDIYHPFPSWQRCFKLWETQWLNLDQNIENSRPYHRTLDSSVSSNLGWSWMWRCEAGEVWVTQTYSTGRNDSALLSCYSERSDVLLSYVYMSQSIGHVDASQLLACLEQLGQVEVSFMHDVHISLTWRPRRRIAGDTRLMNRISKLATASKELQSDPVE
jgi:hypothetical protein